METNKTSAPTQPGNEQKAPRDEDIKGRTHGSENPAFEKEENAADISGIDRQEGDMDNGELGGNLGTDEADNKAGSH